MKTRLKYLLAAAYVTITTLLSLYLLLGIFLQDYPEECAWAIALGNGRVLFCEQGYDDNKTQEILDNWNRRYTPTGINSIGPGSVFKYKNDIYIKVPGDARRGKPRNWAYEHI